MQAHEHRRHLNRLNEEYQRAVGMNEETYEELESVYVRTPY
jgi:hypothetical protein